MTVREKIVDYCEWGIANQAQIHYGQVRPIPAKPRKLPLVTDCSGFATLAYKWAGAPDPNGRDYNGTGYTGTLLAHGDQVAAPLPGDLIIFGEAPGHHVTVYMETWHGAWVTCSHGTELGPVRILNHQESLHQHRPYQVRSYLPRDA